MEEEIYIELRHKVRALETVAVDEHHVLIRKVDVFSIIDKLKKREKRNEM